MGNPWSLTSDSWVTIIHFSDMVRPTVTRRHRIERKREADVVTAYARSSTGPIAMMKVELLKEPGTCAVGSKTALQANIRRVFRVSA
jgi:hypothetical protein